MVYRIFVEKKIGLDNEAQGLKKDITQLLDIKNVKNVRVLNRYDVENIDKNLFKEAIDTVFSEPQIDLCYEEEPISDFNFTVEYLPGQFDQRANSAEECIQIISQSERPIIKTAKVYVIEGELTQSEKEAIKKYVINPVEAREASNELPETLETEYPVPEDVEELIGFNELREEELKTFICERGLAMDLGDISVCQNYFKSENRIPTITEIKVIDTYWSDHCRHTTFNTTLDNITFNEPVLQKSFKRYLETRTKLNRTKPITLMDMGTIAAKILKKEGKLTGLDESEEINACTVKIDVNVNGETEKWLLLFKNETHNHPTEIEPFGGAATCIGGAIRDPLSGRSYVYSAMRVTGAGDPLTPVSETLKGKLPQRKIVTTAANGYSSYGNQIGLATGQVDEIYHPGYVAKRMEVGAVIAAAPEENVVREVPKAGDRIILIGGRTGRDGLGGATGSSKAHKMSSLLECGAEVQKGNAPEERKLQRLFRNPIASKMIKRCNDFGAGGVSVAIGELADGLYINLDKVTKKYEGLDGTELAISESQERMAVVVSERDVEDFVKLANKENLEATVVSKVTEEPRLVMSWRGKTIVNISRAFLNTNGQEKHVDVEIADFMDFDKIKEESFAEGFKAVACDLNSCSKRGLSERFDSTIGATTVLMPFGGKFQRTPTQAMVNKISMEKHDTDTCSLMSWGYNPYISEKSPYHGGYLAVVESVCKLVSHGAEFKNVYLSFQEYFEKLGKDPKKWGKPVSAVLGALDAQLDLEIAAIGGKDSMSGTFEDISVPPTLISFAVTTDKIENIISSEFKGTNHNVYLIKPELNETDLPTGESLKANFKKIHKLIEEKKIVASHTPGIGGIAESIMKMSMGNEIGFKFNDSISLDEIFSYSYGSFIVEAIEELEIGTLMGETSSKFEISKGNEAIELRKLLEIYENKLEPVYNCNIETEVKMIDDISFKTDKKFSSITKVTKPRVLIPIFPGTNCEYDSAKAFENAGAEVETFIIKNLTSDNVMESVNGFAKEISKSNIIFIPGGFSGGDEPDGSGKLITAFFRNRKIMEEVTNLLENRDGLMAGICNGFQALIKLGLLPYGKITTANSQSPTLTFNNIGRHQSKLVRTKVVSNNSPWLNNVNVGDIYTVPISHGEGRFLASDEIVRELAANGQIMTQYVDFNGNPSKDIQFNPNGSIAAVEGILSPDGRVLGKMGHSERIGKGLYKNVIGDYDMKLFKSAVEYFK